MNLFLIIYDWLFSIIKVYFIILRNKLFLPDELQSIILRNVLAKAETVTELEKSLMWSLFCLAFKKIN